MGVLKPAFNMLTRLHSRAAALKRPGKADLSTPDLYSPIRITPANYFRFLEGPSQTTIHGREFIIPVDTMLGSWTQLITFNQVPTSGTWKLNYAGFDTTDLDFDDDAAAVQVAVRAISAALAGLTVTGDYTDGFLVTFFGVNDPVVLTSDVTALDAETTIAESTHVAWSPVIKRADKIIDPTYGPMAIDEIIEIPDIGGDIMAYRVRVE